MKFDLCMILTKNKRIVFCKPYLSFCLSQVSVSIYILLHGACRSYALTPADEAFARAEAPQVDTMKIDPEENDSRETILPGVNLIFDGSKLLPFDIGACLQARQPISLITEAAAVSASVVIK